MQQNAQENCHRQRHRTMVKGSLAPHIREVSYRQQHESHKHHLARNVLIHSLRGNPDSTCRFARSLWAHHLGTIRRRCPSHGKSCNGAAFIIQDLPKLSEHHEPLSQPHHKLPHKWERLPNARAGKAWRMKVTTCSGIYGIGIFSHTVSSIQEALFGCWIVRWRCPWQCCTQYSDRCCEKPAHWPAILSSGVCRPGCFLHLCFHWRKGSWSHCLLSASYVSTINGFTLQFFFFFNVFCNVIRHSVGNLFFDDILPPP